MIREIEEMAMNAWPSLQTKLYDGWVLRFAGGYTKRANCINPLYASTTPLNDKIDFCETQYGLRNLPTIFKITPDSMSEGIDAGLEERGYIRDDEVSLRILPLNQYVCSDPRDIIVESRFTEEWIEGFFSCSDITREGDRLIIRRILANVSGEVICATKQLDDKIVACGYGALERDYVGIFNIIVDKKFRRNRCGKDIMDGILGSAVRRNVNTAYLQVLAGNFPAEKLYDQMGFKELYRYWYRKPGRMRVF